MKRWGGSRGVFVCSTAFSANSRLPPLNFQAETQIKDKREEAIAAIVQLESVRDKTDDPTLRQELDRMSGDLRRTYGIFGTVSPAPREQAGWRHSISPLP